jgi:hypothetical protein
MGILKPWLYLAVKAALKDKKGLELKKKHLDSTATAPSKLEKMLIEANEGEEQFEKKGSYAELEKMYEPKPAASKAVDETKKKSPLPGRRGPHYDKVGADAYGFSSLAGGDGAGQDVAGT